MHVFITGASRGIGKAMRELFEDKGHKVTAPTRKELDLSKQEFPLNIECDVLINNAGINILVDVEHITNQDIMTVNYFSALKMTQLCLPYMKNQRFGRIINIGSIWTEHSKRLRHAYSASKSALHELTKSLTVEYSKYNILANTISPGFIQTDLTLQNNNASQIKQLIESTPIGRLGTTNEIADLAYFLAIDNTFITGQNIIIDGGFSCTRI